MLNRLHYYILLFSVTVFLFSLNTVRLPLIGLSLGVLLIVTLGFLSITIFSYTKPSFNKLTFYTLVTALLLLIWALVVYIINDNVNTGRLIQILQGIIISFSVFIAVRTRKQLLNFIYVLVTAITISSIIGIGQYYFGEPFYSIWEYVISFSSYGVDPRHYYILTQMNRISGLSLYAVPFSYELASITPLFASFLVVNYKQFAFYKKITYTILLFVLLMALFLSGVRSAFLGVLLGIIIVIALKDRKEISTKLVKVMVLTLSVSIIIYAIVGFTFNPQRFINDSYDAARSRYVRNLTAIDYALANPLGTGTYQLTADFVGGLEYVDGDLYALTMRTTSHNQFFNILAYYGFLGLLLLLYFYYLLFRSLKASFYLANSVDLRIIVLGLIGSFVAYIINSLAHNAGPFVGNFFNWFIIGMVFSAASIALSEAHVYLQKDIKVQNQDLSA